jgi:hypothetical protein
VLLQKPVVPWRGKLDVFLDALCLFGAAKFPANAIH